MNYFLVYGNHSNTLPGVASNDTHNCYPKAVAAGAPHQVSYVQAAKPAPVYATTASAPALYNTAAAGFPVAPAPQQGLQQVNMALQPPQSGLARMPDPDAIAKQKEGYIRMLDDQLSEATKALDDQMRHSKEMLYSKAEQQKQQFNTQVDSQVRGQEISLAQQYNEQLISLQQQAAQQKFALEQQAMQLSMEYQQKAAEDEMQKKQIEMKQMQAEMEQKMRAEVVAMKQQGEPNGIQPGISASILPTPSYTPPPVAQHPVGVPSYTPPVSQPSYTPPVVHQSITYSGARQLSFVPPPATASYATTVIQ